MRHLFAPSPSARAVTRLNARSTLTPRHDVMAGRARCGAVDPCRVACGSRVFDRPRWGNVMRMEDEGESRNVEDVRGSGFRPIHGVGLGTLILALIGGWVFGVNPLTILGFLSGANSSLDTAPAQSSAAAPPED